MALLRHRVEDVIGYGVLDDSQIEFVKSQLEEYSLKQRQIYLEYSNEYQTTVYNLYGTAPIITQNAEGKSKRARLLDLDDQNERRGRIIIALNQKKEDKLRLYQSTFFEDFFEKCVEKQDIMSFMAFVHKVLIDSAAFRVEGYLDIAKRVMFVMCNNVGVGSSHDDIYLDFRCDGSIMVYQRLTGYKMSYQGHEYRQFIHSLMVSICSENPTQVEISRPLIMLDTVPTTQIIGWKTNGLTHMCPPL